MDKTRLWLIGSGLLMVVIVALGWMLGVAPQLALGDSASSQKESVSAQNTALEASIAAMRADQANRGRYEKGLIELQRSIPDTLRYSEFVAQVAAAADGAGVTVTSLTSGGVQPYEPPTVPAPAPAAGTAALSASPSGSSSPSASAPAPQSDGTVAFEPQGDIPAVDPKVTAANFSFTPIQLAVTGTKAAVLKFTEAMQRSSRLFMVTTLSLSDDGGTVTASLGGNIYILAEAANANALAKQ